MSTPRPVDQTHSHFDTNIITTDRQPIPVAIVSDDDPGAVGAGRMWVQTNIAGGDNQRLWVRNADDDGWLPLTMPTTLHGTFENQAGGSIYSSDLFFEMVLGSEGGSTSKMGGNLLGFSSAYLFFPESVGATPAGVALLMRGTADPSAGGGVAAPVPSLYARLNGSAGELWIKTGAANTAWAKVTTS